MDPLNKDNLTRAAELLRNSQNAVALTGAGVSVASGIPDFRSPEGIWHKFDPMEFATIETFITHPEKVWQMFKAVSMLVREATPNAAHYSLAALEQAGRLQTVITQNIDGLHQVAGSKNVIELHGTGRVLACPECGYNEPTPETGLQSDPVPCPRVTTVPGSHRIYRFLKPSVVLFGEELPRNAFQEFIHWQNSLDLLMIIGTSADVYPAAALPSAVKALGAHIIEINVGPTRITGIADAYLQGKSEDILPQLQAKVLA
jgi:NAD-dependent deacetylase